VYARDEKLKKVKLRALRRKYELLQTRKYELLQTTHKEYASQYLNKLFILTHQMQRNDERATDLIFFNEELSI